MKRFFWWQFSHAPWESCPEPGRWGGRLKGTMWSVGVSSWLYEACCSQDWTLDALCTNGRTNIHKCFSRTCLSWSEFKRITWEGKRTSTETISLRAEQNLERYGKWPQRNYCDLTFSTLNWNYLKQRTVLCQEWTDKLWSWNFMQEQGLPVKKVEWDCWGKNKQHFLFVLQIFYNRTLQSTVQREEQSLMTSHVTLNTALVNSGSILLQL